MLTVSDAQLEAWIAAFLFPLARILGLVAAAPVRALLAPARDDEQ